MKFGVLFSSSQHPPWSSHYIDYTRLKQTLNILFEDANDELETSFQSDVSTPRRAPPKLGASYYGTVDGGINPSHSGVFIDEPNSPVITSLVSNTNELPMIDGHSNRIATDPIETSRDFQRELNREIQKAVLFIIKTMGELASELSVLMAHQKSLAAAVKPLMEMEFSQRIDEEGKHQSFTEERSKEIFDLRMEYLVRIGNKLLLLLEFVELNVESVTKIVKKHDKRLALWESSNQRRRNRSLSISSYHDQNERYERLRRQYLPRFARFSADPNIRCLFLLAADAGSEDTNVTRNKESDGSFGGWDVMQWNLEKSLRELFNWNEGLKCQSLPATHNHEIGDESQVMENAVLLRTRSKSMSATQSHGNLEQKKRRPRSGSRSSFFGLDALSSMSRLMSIDDTTAKNQGTFFEPVLYRIQYTRRRLGQTTDRYSRMVYAHEMLHIIDDRHLQDEDEKYLIQRSGGKDMEGDDEKWMKDDVPMVSGLSKFLNLASSGLYMCNYVSCYCNVVYIKLVKFCVSAHNVCISSLQNIVAPTSGLYAKLVSCNIQVFILTHCNKLHLFHFASCIHYLKAWF